MTMIDDREMTVTAARDFCTVAMSAGVLRELLSGALVAASKDNTLPAIASVRLEWTSDGMVTAVATDRYRMAVGQHQIPVKDGGVDAAGAVLLAYKDVQALVKALPRVPKNAAWLDTVELWAVDEPGDRSVRFVWRAVAAEGSMVVRVVDADFPRWSSLIPTDETLAEGAMPFTCNPAYLADVARLAPDKWATVRMRTSAAYRPAVFDFPTATDAAVQWMYLLMPVRLTS